MPEAIDKFAVIAVEGHDIALLAGSLREYFDITYTRRVLDNGGDIVARLSQSPDTWQRDIFIRQEAHRYTRASGSHRSSAAVSAA